MLQTTNDLIGQFGEVASAQLTILAGAKDGAERAEAHDSRLRAVKRLGQVSWISQPAPHLDDSIVMQYPAGAVQFHLSDPVKEILVTAPNLKSDSFAK